MSYNIHIILQKYACWNNDLKYSHVTLSHLAYPKWLTNEDNEINQNQQTSNDMQALEQVSVSLTQYSSKIIFFVNIIDK